MQMQPQQYLAYKENWTQQKQVLNNVRQEQSRSVETSINQAKVAMFDEASRTFRTDWADQDKRQQGITELADYAVQEGIFPEELKMLYRTPMLKILDKAHRWDQLQKTQRVTDKRVQGKPKPVRPGTQRSPGTAAQSALEAERQVWESKKSPSVKDALRFLREMQDYETKTGRRA